MARLNRVYYSGFINLSQELVLPVAASHHLITVLRIQLSESLLVFNGDGAEYLAEVVNLQKKNVTIRILEQRTPERESPLVIELAQGISRGERMDYAIQKAVELGVSEITPLFTERCGVKLNDERSARRQEHWNSIIVNACEQSGRLRIPTLNAPCDLFSWLSLKKEGIKLICVPGIEQSVEFAIKPNKAVVLVGPEGGLSEDEVQRAIKAGFQALSLGPRILRTETAAAIAIALAQMRWGDL